MTGRLRQTIKTRCSGDKRWPDRVTGAEGGQGRPVCRKPGIIRATASRQIGIHKITVDVGTLPPPALACGKGVFAPGMGRIFPSFFRIMRVALRSAGQPLCLKRRHGPWNSVPVATNLDHQARRRTKHRTCIKR